MGKLRIHNIDFGLLLALLLPLFAVLPLIIYAGLPNTADGPAHLMRQVELNRAWQEGVLYPRWGADLALGHGMPIFSYAPPLLYHLTQLFHQVGLPLDAAMKAVVGLDFVLYSLGMFLFARRIFGPAPALAAAAVYVYAPYRLREAFIQGNYGQFTGLAFYPLIFWAFHGLVATGKTRYLIAAALSLAGLLLSHNISNMLFLPILGAYLLFLLLLQTNRHYLRFWNYDLRETKSIQNPKPKIVNQFLGIAAAGVLGLGLAAIFWLPAFGEKEAIKLEGITRGFFDFRHNFITLPEFLALPRPLDLAAINPEFPLSLGLPQIIAGGLGILSLLFMTAHLVRRMTNGKFGFADSPFAYSPIRHTRTRSGAERGSQCWHTAFFTAFLLGYAFLALPASQPVWETAPLLELAEFPWRMLGPALFCAAFLAAPALAWLTGQLTPRPQRPVASPVTVFGLLFFILIAVILNAWYLFPSQFIPWGTPGPADAFAYEVVSGAIGTTSTGEFLPRGAQQHPQPHTLWPDYEAGRPPQKLDPAALPPGTEVTGLYHGVESDSMQINTPAPFTATLRTLYWPGWQVYLDGQPAPFTVTPKTGLIQTAVPVGRHTLTLRLESTPLRQAGTWLSLASAVGLGLLAVMALARQWANRQGQFARGKGQIAKSKEHRANEPTRSAAISWKHFLVIAMLLITMYLLSRPLAPWFTVRSNPNQPQPAAQSLQVDFADQLRLVGMDNLPKSISLPGEFTTVLYWRALQDVDTNYAVFLHLDAPNGETYATADERHPENIPTRNWPPGLYLRNPLQLALPANLPPIRYDLNVGVYDPETGQRLPVQPTGNTTMTIGRLWLAAPRPPVSAQPLVRFGPDIQLWQADYHAETRALTLYWQTDVPVAENYSIFIHLLDTGGGMLAQADGVPYNGLYPPSHWQPRQIITDARALPVGSAPPAAIAVGVYNLNTGLRLPVIDIHGNTLANDSFVLPVGE